jgi:hypothetical protein
MLRPGRRPSMPTPAPPPVHGQPRAADLHGQPARELAALDLLGHELELLRRLLMPLRRRRLWLPGQLEASAQVERLSGRAARLAAPAMKITQQQGLGTSGEKITRANEVRKMCMG